MLSVLRDLHLPLSSARRTFRSRKSYLELPTSLQAWRACSYSRYRGQPVKQFVSREIRCCD